jgi:lipopolysaccharide export system permease protein
VVRGALAPLAGAAGMNLMERYIAGTVLRATLLTLLTVLGLLVFFEFIDAMEDVGQGDFGLLTAIIIAASAAPRFAFDVLPVAALLGSLLGLGSLASHGELGAMRAAGMSLRGIVLAVIKAGILLLAGVFVIGDVLTPAAEQYAQRLKADTLSEQVSLTSQYGVWARDGLGFINVRRIAPGGRLEDVYIYDMSSIGELQLATHAASAEYVDQEWTLRGVRESQLSENHVLARTAPETRRAALIDPVLIEVSVMEPAMLPIWELRQYIDYLQENGQSSTAYEVEFWNKVFTPFSILVMLFLAVPVVLGSLRSVSIGQRIFVGAFIGAGFHLLTRGLSYVALVYQVEPALATGLPLVVFAAGGVFLLWRLR